MTALDVRAGAATSDPVRSHNARRRSILVMVGRRMLFIVPVIIVVSAGLFAAAAISPFDPLVGYLGTRYMTTSEADKALIAAQMGFDNPWYSTYWTWLHAVVTGDLGVSRSFNQPVSQVISERLPWTLLLVGISLVIAILASLALGVLAGIRKGGLLDRTVSGLCVVVQGLPPFVLSLGAIALFALTLGWLPVAGLTDGGADPTAGQVIRHLILPVAVLAISQMPWLLLAVRESVVGSTGEGFVAGAVARGIPASTITQRHIVPTSLAPFVNIIGVRLPELVVGAVLVEEVFSWPGIAGAIVSSARDLDMALLAFLTVGTTLTVMLGSLLADVVVALLDPRVSTDG
ncbi:MAG: ABC transporter permease [Rhodococcus sp. (in: high G+C Gram-positive bacteria)]|uniref:ABC transporter permease n=1 Tax=Rhodococcus sp. TaxID=1831 RepID=UPI0011F79D9F|nr:ABC transporter permease [Rhodococcus sp. (in: high G+C Gram-positive bacteria)]RZL26030.1 MAG: ABC transporter permease [Rhodococcus sp. (in: high G+C Gram-positive bacteria)]